MNYIDSSGLNGMVRVALFVFYNNRMIAAIDELGKIVWRDERYPLCLIEYLIRESDHKYKLN